jgi:hypothetical protein
MKKHKRLREICAVTVISVLVFGTAASAWGEEDSSALPEGAITKDYEFTAHSKDYSYDDAPKEITEDGKTYTLSHIDKYTLQGSEVYAEKKVAYANLAKKEIPNTVLEGDVTYTLKEQPNFEAETVTYAEDSSSNAPAAITIAREGQEFTAHLVSSPDQVTETYTEQEPFTVAGKFFGPEGTKTYDFDGAQVTLGDGSTPAWEGHEAVLLKYFKLPEGSKITSAKWDDKAIVENGESVRYATFNGTKPVQKTRQKSGSGNAVYEYKRYSCEAVYTNGFIEGTENYKVVATAVYSPVVAIPPTPPAGLSTLAKVLIGSGAAAVILAAFIVLALYLLRKKRKKEQQTE